MRDSDQRTAISSARELKVYQMAYALAMEIFRLSKACPSEKGCQCPELEVV